MESFELQLLLNSVGGVFVGMAVIPRLLSSPKDHLVAIVGIYVLFFSLNFMLLLDRFGIFQSVLRGMIVAIIPFVLGYGWSIILKKAPRE